MGNTPVKGIEKWADRPIFGATRIERAQAENTHEHMKTLLIVYHSKTGGTEQMARAAAQAAGEEAAVQVRPLRAVSGH